MKRFVRAFAAAGLLIATGCAMSAEDRVVGIYSLDVVRSSLPDIPGNPGIQSRMNQVKRNMRLKIRSDHTFVLTGIRISEGSWQLDGETLRLKPKDPEPLRIFLNEDGEFLARTEHDALVVEPAPILGKVTFYLHKTG